MDGEEREGVKMEGGQRVTRRVWEKESTIEAEKRREKR